jgi:hypothetical protein
MPRYVPDIPDPHRSDHSDGGIATLQAVVWVLTFLFMLISMFEFIEPDAGGFAVNFKRLVAAVAITVGGYGISRLAIMQGAPLAAAGSGVAQLASALTFGVLTPTIVILSYLALAGPEVRRMNGIGNCSAIRLSASQLDEIALAHANAERSVKVIRADVQQRGAAEADRGRESGKASVRGRPQPVANVYQNAQRYAGLAEEQLLRGATDRASAVRDVASLADECERATADPQKWRKDGPATVAAIYDRAGARLRELAQAAPLGSVRGLIDQLRTLGATDGDVENTALEAARRVIRDHADRLDKELAALPRMPEGLAPLAATPLLVAAFEPSKFAATWPSGLIAILVEGGSPLLWIYAYVRAQRRLRYGEAFDDDDAPSPPRPNGRGRPYDHLRDKISPTRAPVSRRSRSA